MKRKVKRIKNPWPTKQAMTQVYEMKLWGAGEEVYYSGVGSHHPDIVAPYISVVTSFLKTFTPPLVVCDLGCGDFNVGKQLVKHSKRYIAIDIVADLIAHNKEKYKDGNLEFHCLDIAVDKLPSGDCVLIRQVLQHVSNNEVQRILDKVSHYKYVILTEHIPDGEFIPNKDVISGQGTRLKKGSGVDVLAPPFHFKPRHAKQLLCVASNDGKGKIVTTLYTNT